MGLFGFIGKAIGSVVKTGLGIATHGASDLVLNTLKGGNKAAATAQTIRSSGRLPIRGLGTFRGVAGLLGAKDQSGRVLSPYFKPLVRTQGIITSPGGYASATPVMPGGALIPGVPSGVSVAMQGVGGRRVKRRSGKGSADARKRRRGTTAAKSSRGKKVLYKGRYYSRKQVANMKRFARQRRG